MDPCDDKNSFTIIGSKMCARSGCDIKKEQPQPITKSPPDDISFRGIKSTPINCVSWPSSAWEDGSRRSAFHPYKPTILTNLQRGNIKSSEHPVVIPCTKAAWFENAGRGNIELAQIKRRPVNELDDDDLTALMWSAAYGQCSNAELLIKNGANVEMKGKSLETALHLAAAGGHHDVIKLLIANGAGVNEIDEDGNTPLIYAVYGDHPHAVDELLLSGANMFISNHEGVMPYNLAVEYDCSEGPYYAHLLCTASEETSGPYSGKAQVDFVKSGSILLDNKISPRVVLEMFLLEMVNKKMPSSLIKTPKSA